MNVVITGADGFVGKNLRARLMERKEAVVVPVTRRSTAEELRKAAESADFVFHLAGVNRPADPNEFSTGNADFTASVCDALAAAGRRTPVVFTSSIQAELDNPYGASKRAAEGHLRRLRERSGNPVHLFRLPNIFGKWSRPNYNSAVATFCHNVVRDLPLTVHDAAAEVRLVYIDDVVDQFLKILDGRSSTAEVQPAYTITVGELAEQIRAFKASRASLVGERVGAGLVRALYSTYVSFLDPDGFAYDVPKHEDPRGMFVEMLKTKDSGQFSFFTAHPGVTRGSHYHHSKTEKFLVVQGEARFRFRHLLTQATHEVRTSAAQPRIVDTVPGWVHDITNVGRDEMVVLLWANEVFDKTRPDTIAHDV